MTIKSVGKLDSWDDADLGGGNFMKLEEGSNPVRIFTSPHQFYTVWAEDKSGKNRKFRSAVNNCPLIERGEKATARWYVGALDRRSGSAKILEVGPQIYKQILALSKKASWGDPRGYDIDIERKPKGSNPLYVVLPESKSPFTEEEKVLMREFQETVDLVELTKPPTREEVLEQMGEVAAPVTKTSKVDNDFSDFANNDTIEAEGDDDFNF